MMRKVHKWTVAAGVACAVAVLVPWNAAWAAERAGVAAAVVGDVTLTGEPRPEPVPAKSGADVFRFDRVVTESDSRLQIMLLDETNFSVGPNSELVIDEFVYDPEQGVGKVTADVVEGVFRYVSGNVGKSTPENVEVKTPAGTIGIRGTIVWGRADKSTGEVFVGLFGPGARNNAGLSRGGFTFSNDQGASTVIRSGYGVRVTPGQAPSDPVPIPTEVVNNLQESLQGRTARAADQARQTDTEGEVTSQASGTAPKTPLSDPEDASGQLEASAQALGQDLAQSQSQSARLGGFQGQAVEEGAARIMDEIPEQVAGMRHGDVGLPSPDAMLAQLSWGSGVDDLDLHVTGPNANGEGRFHVNFTNRGSLSEAPFTALDDDYVGAEGNEVAAIESFNQGGPYRISAFNFGDSGPDSTSLANESNAILSLFQGGAIERGPSGSVVVNADLLQQITPPSDAAGNTWVGFEIEPGTQNIEIINEITSYPNSTDVE